MSTPNVTPAIPCTLHAHGRVMNGGFRIDFRNDGETDARFQVRSSTDVPRTYTVEAGHSLSGWWDGVAETDEYDFSVQGPNGFLRNFRGTLSGADSRVVDISASYDIHAQDVLLRLSNPTCQELIVSIFDRHKSRTTVFVIDPGESESRRWTVQRTDGWYDLTVTVGGNGRFATQLAGHVENVEDRISQPLMARLV